MRLLKRLQNGKQNQPLSTKLKDIANEKKTTIKALQGEIKALQKDLKALLSAAAAEEE